HAGGEQVAQVDDRVGLDVHHVAEAHDVPVGQGVIRDLGPVDPAQIDLLRVTQVAVEIELDQGGLTHRISRGGALMCGGKCDPEVVSPSIYEVQWRPVHS